MKLEPNVLLQREPDLRIRLRPSGEIEVEREDGALRAGSRGLAVLEAFSQPLSIEAALRLLVPGNASRAEGLDTLETIFGMLNAGILRRVDADAVPRTPGTEATDALPGHIRLLNDRPRTASFLSAIEEVVRPGDVVADVGTGTGVLAVAAARAGARRVYAIEEGGIAVQASRLFEASGCSDRISLVRGRSYSVSLPERADVLVTETIGDDPLDERIVDIVADARRRLLKDGARVIPGSLTVYAQAFRIPERDLEPLTFGPEAVRAWRDAYAMDFEPVRRATEESLRRRRLSPYRAREWLAVQEPWRLLDVDLASAFGVPLEAVIALPPAGERPNGLLVFFEARLSPSVLLSTRPSVVGADTSWTSPLWLLPSVGPLPAELRFRFEARRRIHLDWPSDEAALPAG